MDNNQNLDNVPQPDLIVVKDEHKRSPFIWFIVPVVVIVIGSALFFLNKKFPLIRNANNGGAPTQLNSSSSPVTFQRALVDVPFVRQSITINPAIAQKFSLSEIKNIPDIEKAYGFTFSKNDLASLEQNKFLLQLM